MHLNAGNDRNGNPRRLWMTDCRLATNEYDDEQYIEHLDEPKVWDDGYEGAPQEIREMLRLFPLFTLYLNITPQEYSSLRSNYITNRRAMLFR